MNGGREFELRHWRSRSMSVTIPPTPASLPPLSTPSPFLNGELSSASYTSLRDIMRLADPSADGAVGSPSPSGGREVQIRNRLLNKAACAYLQPTPSDTESGRRRRRRGFSLRRALSSCFGFIGTFFRRAQIAKRT